MKFALRAAAAVLAAVLCRAAQAEELTIPVGAQHGIDAGTLPPRGMLMESVRAGWGEPQTRLDPVGEPPITRWDYPDFAVVFEHDHVVHAVVRHRRTDSETR